MAGKSLVVGIDPGFSGALAALSNGDIVSIIDMPVSITLSDKQQLDSRAIHHWLMRHNPSLVVIERVHSMPKQGLSSTFRFGEGYGIIQGIVATLNARVLMPPPAVWKAAMNVTTDKNTSLERIRREFPKSSLFGRKKDNGRAEALLLAMFGARSLSQVSRGGDLNDIL